MEKLEEEKIKGLSLDSQRNRRRRHHHHQQEYQGGDEGGDETNELVEEHPPPTLQYPQPPQPPPPPWDNFHHPLFLQQPHEIEQLKQLYGHIEPQPLSISNSQQTKPIKRRSYFPSSSSGYANREMEGTHYHSQTTSSRLALRNAGAGEIVEVQGGHIVRSTGRKDRHSKVCTAKGPRDRRVRLSAHTAIQFYDVQDRLGYDRPSKAVDWLIMKAKNAIDELAELPAWKPSDTILSEKSPEEDDSRAQPSRNAAEAAMVGEEGGRGIYVGQDQQQHQQMCNNADSCSLLPPSLDSDAIADTIKSFFPMGAATHSDVVPTTSSSPPPPLARAMQFQNYPPDLLSRTRSHSEDLRLSLQSFQDPMLLHSHHHQPPHHAHHSSEQHSLFPEAVSPLGFDNPSAGWAENHPMEMGRFQRHVSWNTGSDSGGEGGGGAFMFNSPPSTSAQLQPLFGHGHAQFFSQRGPLQSSSSPLIRAWISDPSIASTTDHHQTSSIHPQSISGIGFTTGGFSGFHVPARIQGEEEHDGNPNKPSSASSISRH